MHDPRTLAHGLAYGVGADRRDCWDHDHLRDQEGGKLMPLPFLPALVMPSIIKRIFSPLASLWRWMTDDWHRMAFAVLIALCAFLGWRLNAIDGSRDDWRDKAQSYEAAAKALAEADKVADRIGMDAAVKSKGEVDARIERAKQAGADSPDPLGDTVRCLRSEADCGSD